MKVFAIVHSKKDLPRACRELCQFFSILQKRNRGVKICESLIGIWLHSRMTASPPSALSLKYGSSRVRRIAVNQSISLSGIWTLCWLDLPPNESKRFSHIELLAALLRSEPVLIGGKSGKFIPVFPSTAPDSEVRTALDYLQQSFPTLTLATMYLDVEKAVPSLRRDPVSSANGRQYQKVDE